MRICVKVCSLWHLSTKATHRDESRDEEKKASSLVFIDQSFFEFPSRASNFHSTTFDQLERKKY